MRMSKLEEKVKDLKDKNAKLAKIAHELREKASSMKQELKEASKRQTPLVEDSSLHQEEIAMKNTQIQELMDQLTKVKEDQSDLVLKLSIANQKSKGKDNIKRLKEEKISLEKL